MKSPARAIREAGRVMTAYVSGLWVSAGVVVAALVMTDHSVGSLPILAALCALGVLAERASVRLSSTVEVSISSLPMLFAAVVMGPLDAMIISAASQIGILGRPYLKWAIYTPADAMNAAVTGLVAAEASRLSSSTIGSIAIATAAAVVTHQLIGVIFSAVTVQLRRSGTAWGVVQTLVPVIPPSVLLWVAVLAPLAIAYELLSPWAALLFLFPALAAQRLFIMYQEQRRLAAELTEANQSLRRANLSFASALVTTLDARDRYTAGHSAAVAVYARDIAEKMGRPSEIQQLAHLSGLLHDIGKIGVPPGILEKNGPLTLQERRKMEEHSVIGERILANVEAYAEIARIVRHHHERLDGQGYPDGLTSIDIPLISRIICVADAYNAMTSDRPYRDAMRVEVARSRLLQAAGTQFDPEVVSAFDELLENASETYTSGARADFALEAQAHPELSGSLEVSAA
jgi:putative nucleotidyltransferase with HDIG domain